MFSWLCAPIDKNNMDKMQVFDFILTCTPGFKDELQKLGFNVFLSYHAFDKDLVNIFEKKKITINHDFLFTGSIFPGKDYHEERSELLTSMLRSGIDLKIYGNIYKESYLKNFIKNKIYDFNHYLIKKNINPLNKKLKNKINFWHNNTKNIPLSKTLKKNSLKPVYGVEMYKKILESNVIINSHIGIAGNYAGNVRLF